MSIRQALGQASLLFLGELSARRSLVMPKKGGSGGTRFQAPEAAKRASGWREGWMIGMDEHEFLFPREGENMKTTDMLTGL